jgi:hypothetical protein
MRDIDPKLVEAASQLQEALLSLGMHDRALVVGNIVSRAARNVRAEREIGSDVVERTEQAVRSVSNRLRDVLSQRRMCNSDILALIEDSQEDISSMIENGERCPDFVSIPAGMLTSGVSRVMRRMFGGRPSDGLGHDSICILHRAVQGASKYSDEEQ